MTRLDRTADRYHNDNAFRAAVDMMQALILDLQLSPSEIREAAMFACYLVEARRPLAPIVFGESPYRSAPPLERRPPPMPGPIDPNTAKASTDADQGEKR